MTDIEGKAVARVGKICMERGIPFFVSSINRHVCPVSEALCRALEQHEAFKQEVSDAITVLLDRFVGDSLSQGVINGHLHQFIIPKPKPDPLVEALKNMDAVMERLEAFRAALEALEIEIREKGQ